MIISASFFSRVFFCFPCFFFGGGKKHLREILCFFLLQISLAEFWVEFFLWKRWASWEAECHFKLKRIRSGTAWSWSWCYFPIKSCVLLKHVFSQVSIFCSSLPMFILSRYVFTYHATISHFFGSYFQVYQPHEIEFARLVTQGVDQAAADSMNIISFAAPTVELGREKPNFLLGVGSNPKRGFFQKRNTYVL